MPVDPDDVAGYKDVITERMDFSTMQHKLEANQYTNVEDSIGNAMLIFDTCRKFNDKNTPYTKSADILQKQMYRQIRDVQNGHTPGLCKHIGGL